MVTTVEMTVKTTVIPPTHLAWFPFLSKYLIPGHKPSGGKKIAKAYSPICSQTDTAAGLALILCPQLGQK